MLRDLWLAEGASLSYSHDGGHSWRMYSVRKVIVAVSRCCLPDSALITFRDGTLAEVYVDGRVIPLEPDDPRVAAYDCARWEDQS